LLSYFIMAALMGGAIYALGWLPFPNHWSMLLAQIVTGTATYLWLCWIFRLNAFLEIWLAGSNHVALLRGRIAAICRA
jgi:hypothetical protein